MHLVSVLCIPVSSIPTSLSFLKSFCPCNIVLPDMHDLSLTSTCALKVPVTMCFYLCFEPSTIDNMCHRHLRRVSGTFLGNQALDEERLIYVCFIGTGAHFKEYSTYYRATVIITDMPPLSDTLSEIIIVLYIKRVKCLCFDGVA